MLALPSFSGYGGPFAGRAGEASSVRADRAANLSYFAFTATPKAKTLELFGTLQDIDGKGFVEHLREAHGNNGDMYIVTAMAGVPLIGLMLLRDLRGILALSTAIGVAITLGGLGLSYAFDLPSGPAIIVLGALLLFAVYAARKLRGGALRSLPALRRE